MALERVSPGILGYDPEQVDALMDRIRRQYENPQSRIITPSMLAVVRFELISGGYRIDQVDQSIATVAEDFEKREVERRLDRIGKTALVKETRRLLGDVLQVLELDPKKRFSPARNGYNPKLVNRLLAEFASEDGVLKGPATMEIRLRPLGTARLGPNRTEVNEFLSLLVGILNRQELIASN